MVENLIKECGIELQCLKNAKLRGDIAAYQTCDENFLNKYEELKKKSNSHCPIESKINEIHKQYIKIKNMDFL